jgi:RimJ/RimL family protein N-acetyltransferase
MITRAPSLFTDRLHLRGHQLADKADHVAMWADPRVTRFIGGMARPMELSWGKYLSSAGLWPVMGYGYWVFADRATDRLIGMGGLSYFARELPELEGFPEAGWAFDADHWNAGFATEAMKAALAWADEHLHDREVRAIIDLGNAPSHRVAEKLGFRRFSEGFAGGTLVDIYRRPRGG